MGSIFTVSVEGEDTLIVHTPNQPAMELEPLRGTEFAVKGGPGTTIEFRVDDAGVVTGVALKQPMGEVIAARQTV